MATRSEQQHFELKELVIRLQEQVATFQRDEEEQNRQIDKLLEARLVAERERTQARLELAETKLEVALVRQQSADNQKRIDKWDTRLWAVVAGVLLFLLSSVITLVVAITRK